MTDILPITLALGDRKIEFKMLIDADFIADQHLAAELRQFGCAEPEVVAAMFHIVRPGDLVIDGGANTGFFTCVLSRLVGETGSVLSYEPDRANIEKLQANLEANGMTNVKVDFRPLWERTDEVVTLYRAKDSGFSSLAPITDDIIESQERRTARLDCSDNPRLIKLDIEGAEEKVLCGAIRMGFPYIIAELNEQCLNKFGCTGESLRSRMYQRAFSTFALHPKGNLPIFVHARTKIITQWQNTNVLFSTLDSVATAWPEMYIEH